MAQKKRKSPAGPPAVAEHRRARFDYDILEEIEAGIVLRGTEVKALRAGGRISIDEAFCRIRDGEVWLVQAHIPEYAPANRQNHDPVRQRKLLLRKKQIAKLKARVEQRGLTLIPLRVYFSERGLAKVRIGVVKGRKRYDKRQELKKRDDLKSIRS